MTYSWEIVIVLLIGALVLSCIIFLIYFCSKSPDKISNFLTVVNIFVTAIFAAAAVLFAFQQLQINKTLSEFEISKQRYDSIYYTERLKITLSDLEYYNNHYKTFETRKTDDVKVMNEVFSNLRIPLEAELRNPQLLNNDSLRIYWLYAIDVCKIIEWPEGLPETNEINNTWYNIQLTKFHRILNKIHWFLYPEQLEAIIKMTEKNQNTNP